MSTSFRLAVVFSLVALGATGGCKKEPAPEPAPSATASVAAPPASADPAAPSASAAGAEPGEPEIPLPEDYAEQAAKEITEQNLEAELTKLEKEVAGTEE